MSTGTGSSISLDSNPNAFPTVGTERNVLPFNSSSLGARTAAGKSSIPVAFQAPGSDESDCAKSLRECQTIRSMITD